MASTGTNQVNGCVVNSGAIEVLVYRFDTCYPRTMPRPLIIASLLGASIGVPYLASRMPHGVATSNTEYGSPVTAVSGTATATLTTPTVVTHNTNNVPEVETLAKPASYPTIEQVFRFDITKAWVYQRWARKSTWPTDVGLVGVRVQLVTGTQLSALAGALTYYFNSYDQLEHISFHGRTGEPTPLVAFLARTYEFQPGTAPPGEQLYQVKRGSRVQSELRLRPEAVISGKSPHGTYIVELELARPNSRRYLPPRSQPLNIPPATATSPPPTPENQSESKAESVIPSYFGQGRYATPQEEAQVLWKRWPN